MDSLLLGCGVVGPIAFVVVFSVARRGAHLTTLLTAIANDVLQIR